MPENEGKGFLEEQGDKFIKQFTSEEFANTAVKLDNAAREVAKSFGSGSERIQEIKNGLADSIVEVTKLGGDFEFIKKTQLEISKELGRNIVLNQDLYKDLYAAQAVTGENVKDIVSKFKDVGANTYQAVEGMQKVVDVSRKSGVNAQAVSGQVLRNMDAMNKFTFQGGVEGMAKMAAQAVSLRFDMSKILTISEKLWEPEGAIELAASLQRLGAQQTALLDPLKLMDMQQNDPAELQNQIVQLSQQFVQLNEKGQFEIMPGARRQLREIEKELGFSSGELAKMALGAADLDKKMSEISFSKLTNLTEDQQKMIANMAEMGKGGQYEVSVYDKDKGEMVKKAVGELRKEDVEYLEKAGDNKSLEQLALEQLNLSETIAANTKLMAEGLKFSVARTGAATKIIETGKYSAEKFGEVTTPSGVKPGKLAPFIDENLNKFGDALGELIKGDKNSLENFAKIMGEVSDNVRKYGNEMGVEMDKISKNIASEAMKSDRGYVRQMATGASGIVNTIDKNIFGDDKINKNAKLKTGDFTIEALPQDSIKIVGGTNLDNSNTMTQQNVKTTSEITININANPDVNKLFENMNINKEQFRQELMATITKATNSGVVGNTNPNNNPMIMSPTFT